MQKKAVTLKEKTANFLRRIVAFIFRINFLEKKTTELLESEKLVKKSNQAENNLELEKLENIGKDLSSNSLDGSDKNKGPEIH
ncbi:MAG: hypothetical protein LBI70_03055 [Rickettsiales bacterium]|nr:hypothetical protein [Rickettsiales bacterium]